MRALEPKSDRFDAPIQENMTLPQINTGNTGFLILRTGLAVLTTPGLAFFYGGPAHRRNVLGVTNQSSSRDGLM